MCHLRYVGAVVLQILHVITANSVMNWQPVQAAGVATVVRVIILVSAERSWLHRSACTIRSEYC